MPLALNVVLNLSSSSIAWRESRPSDYLAITLFFRALYSVEESCLRELNFEKSLELTKTGLLRITP